MGFTWYVKDLQLNVITYMSTPGIHWPNDGGQLFFPWKSHRTQKKKLTASVCWWWLFTCMWRFWDLWSGHEDRPGKNCFKTSQHNTDIYSHMVKFVENFTIWGHRDLISLHFLFQTRVSCCSDNHIWFSASIYFIFLPHLHSYTADPISIYACSNTVCGLISPSTVLPIFTSRR